jgi:cell division protease FtsH
LGGRVAEALVLDDISTGASSDIERATKTARAMVTKYGMTDALGPITYGTDNSEPFLGRDMGHVRNYSEETASQIDSEIKNIVSTAYNKTESILKEHMDKLHAVAKFLYTNEKMSGEQFAAVMEGKTEEEIASEPAPGSFEQQ